MKLKLACLSLMLVAFQSMAQETDTSAINQRVEMKDGKITIHLQGHAYESGVQFDLSDPDMVLTIETDPSAAPQALQPLPEPTNDELESELENHQNTPAPEEDSPFNEAKALALKVEAQERAVSGDFDQALQLLNEAQPLTAQPAKILATKGSVLYKLGNVESAIVAWQQALELDPNLGEVKRMMEWLEK
ncbi:tetratricopeptide repeat protein [Vibrio nigripulchritudo]|uniref:tetratricopeptide repeat protein n=1 Tax=Vibrio nigripulchritudo TaxID=28173 RepID=UPI002492FC75|nr:tetratricopeptide repeat protein [Vibrio nigripulchritudo]BDU38218.1 hypothetical protein TUMSATVNIG2_26870 [Vibrio nigripulchritudo]BDU43941.1 hypothetical protein TUMSATVNIG3_27390 [Vibrio nigripulchritudo]